MNPSSENLRILVTGGGTGGHVGPALATIGEIKNLARNQTDLRPVFCYIGSEDGVERRLATAAGLDFVGVQTGKLRRSARWTGMLTRQNLRDGFRVPVGIAQALGHVARWAPDVVFSTGGFVSVPPVVAGWLRGVPVLIHEQTVQVGLANRITARFARRIALTFEGSADELPARLRAKAFVSGNPVRPILFNGDKTRAISLCGFDPADRLPTVYITGGAQGARIINRAVEAVLPEMLRVCRVVHQCGQQPPKQEQDFDRLRCAHAALDPALRRRYHVMRFIDDEIGDVWALADLVVGRAGAGTVTEVAALGKPALFIPLVPTGGDEQTRNARRLVEAGAAVILKQDQADGPRLLAEVDALLANPARLDAMGQAARTLARPHAARDLAEAVVQLATSGQK